MNSYGWLQQSLRALVQSLENAAIADHKGQVLYLKQAHPFDPGTWSEAFKLALKYFNMNEGDVIMFNDPLSGGNDFSVFSFITCLQKQQDSKSGIFLGHRVTTPLSIKEILNPPKNYFRVPFTPVAQSGQIQEAFLDAMAGSPMAPAKLKELLMTEIHRGISVMRKFEGFPKELVHQKTIQNFIAATREQALSHLHEKPWGETKVEMPLDTGEVIKLTLDINETGVRIDFGGTTSGKEFFLPPGALAGICTYWLSQYAGLEGYLNEGLFSIFQVSQPLNSCLAAKSSQPTQRGYKTGARVISTALDIALSKINLKPPRGISNHFGVYVQVDFPNKESLEFYLPNGAGAKGDSEGTSGLDCFHEHPYFSTERAENKCPVRILRMDLRNSTHGKGKVNGGRGLIYKLEALADAECYWLSDLTKFRFPVQKFQTTPDPVEIIVEENKPLPSSGHCQLKAAQVLTVGSASGGGLI
jgi:N-methylhydantoinase B